MPADPATPPSGAGAGAHPRRWILHVDMDAFFASVEALDNPSLAGRPLVVGGAGPRGVVASCSYEARAFGVRSAMPSVQARRLCPQAVFVPGRYDRYAEVSRQMHSIFHRFTPLVEGISLDEAFLDITGATRLFGAPAEIGRSIRAAVADELGLSCSVGAATVKFLAKLASEAAKPAAAGVGRPGDGVFVVEPGQELAFLHPHRIEALWGVGPATADRLRQLGISTIADLARLPVEVLDSRLGRASGRHLSRLARGLDDRLVEPARQTKSVSHEETYAHDRRDPAGLHVEVVRMADAVAHRMRTAGLAGRTVTIKVRYGDFSTRTRSLTSAVPVETGPVIARMAAGLLEQVDLAPGVRLLGVAVSNLMPTGDRPPEQLALELGGAAQPPPAAAAPSGGVPSSAAPSSAALSSAAPSPAAPLTAAAAPSSAAASLAVDAVRRRFGAGAVGPAALVAGGRLRVKRQGDAQWGPTGAKDRPEG